MAPLLLLGHMQNPIGKRGRVLSLWWVIAFVWRGEAGVRVCTDGVGSWI